MPLFWERSVIEITPVRVILWREGKTNAAPEVHEIGAMV
jgi:hypothetical protein